MTISQSCADIRPSLPELALGSLTGTERARALEHVAACSECRRELQALSEVGDELLALTPVAEPPVGFESRVVARMEGAGRGRRRRRAPLIAASLIAAAIAGSAVYVATVSDRELAEGYRTTLDVADGRYFSARPLVGDDGREVGHVFGYAGSTSWIFCVVEEAGQDGAYSIRVESESGRGYGLGEMRAASGSGTWAGTLPIDLHDVARVEFTARAGDARLVADWSD